MIFQLITWKGTYNSLKSNEWNSEITWKRPGTRFYLPSMPIKRHEPQNSVESWLKFEEPCHRRKGVKLNSNSKFEFNIENYLEVILLFFNNPSCPLGINFDSVMCYDFTQCVSSSLCTYFEVRVHTSYISFFIRTKMYQKFPLCFNNL